MPFEDHKALRRNLIDKYARTKFALWELSREIYEYAYEHYSLPFEWERDNIVVTSHAPMDADFGFEQLTLVTPSPREVIWLFGRLRDAFGDLISGPGKLEFYARLAEAIRIHEIAIDREHKLNSVLRAAMLEAFLILEEMEKGTVQMRPDNQITSIVEADTTTQPDVCVRYPPSKVINASA
ncbi:MAG: hypothetical protein ABR568_16160 [Pyrinomonadaceae bacterium]